MRTSLGVILAFSCTFADCATARPLTVDIKGTSLVALMNLKITSLSRKTEAVGRAAAAVYVLTGEEIARTGVTHIAEALRYVPGVEVARLQANQWAVSVRGFNSRTANKLLVMIDGRSIYSSLFSGVLWEEKDMPLENIDRVEIIRGPGGAIWGANAVNGIINIITKSADKTQNLQFKIGGGIEERGLATARFGWRNENQYTRVDAMALRRDEAGGALDDDHGEMARLGFRHDVNEAERYQLRVQGELYQGSIGRQFSDISEPGQTHTGGHVLVDWSLQYSARNSHQLLAYYDNTLLELGGFIDDRHTVNFDYQWLHKREHQEFTVGAGYRTVRDDVRTYPLSYIEPQRQTDRLYSAYLQDEISLSDSFRITLGAKVEDNNYTGVEWQPSIRTAWAIEPGLLWAAWSRAVRTPTRLEASIVTPSLPDYGRDFDAEEVSVYEAGWRGAINPLSQLDASIYRAEYRNLRSNEITQLRNNIAGDVLGVEFSYSYQLKKDWLVRINSSYAKMSLRTTSGSLDTTTVPTSEGTLPRTQIQLMSLYDIGRTWQINTYLRYVDQLDFYDIKSYVAADLSLVWRPKKSLRLQLVGRHLGDRARQEWGTASTTEVQPDLAVYVTWTPK